MKKQVSIALKRQRAITALAESEGRDLTEAEEREFNTLQSIIEAASEGDGAGAAGEGKRNTENDNNSRDEGEHTTPTTSGESGADGGTSEENRQHAGLDVETAATIMDMCRHFGANPADYLRRGFTTPEQVSRELINEQMKNNAPIKTGIKVTDDEGDKFRRAAADGIILKSGGEISDMKNAGNNMYRAMSIREIAIEALERENPDTDYRHMRADGLWGAVQRDFYNPTSAFAAITDNAVQKSYIEGLAKANTSFEKFVKVGSLPDFKETKNSEYLMSLTGLMDEIPENGELKAYVPKDVKVPARQLKTFGKQFTMTRQAFINDDIGMITTMPRRYAAITQQTQNRIVYNLLLNKAKIFDGKPLFSNDRKNVLATGTGVTLDSMKKMIYMIGTQKDAAGNQLAVTPDLFIVPFGLGADVRQILGSPFIHTAENTQAANPYYDSNFEIVEDVTINGMLEPTDTMPWFMGAKGSFIQIDYLNGNKNATIKRAEIPGTLGLVWDIFFDFGVSIIHPEAICKNPGIVQNLGE